MYKALILGAFWASNAFAYDFVPWQGTPSLDHFTERLCPAAYHPDEVEEKWFIACDLEGANYATSAPLAKNQFSVMAFNMERGYKLDLQVNGFLSGEIPLPDIILISEADRGCSRSDYRNTAKELAQALSMNYAFGVEFVELERKGGSGGRIDSPCEHGQAILSRYPLGNVELKRHIAHGDDKYVPAPERFDSTEEARLGTRADLIADVKLGEQFVRVASIHYDDGIFEKKSQTEQARETVRFLSDSPLPVIIGGDTNSHYYFLDLKNAWWDGTIKAYIKGGYQDAHRILGFKASDRKTINNKVAGLNINAVVDVIFTDKDWVTAASICQSDACNAASDHRPVVATFDFSKLP